MEQLTCFYHPNREATKKCSKCGKMICLECQKTVRTRTTSHAINERVYCPDCGKQATKMKGIMFVVGTALLLVMLYLVLKLTDFI